jgi:3-dehydroquinate synthetase
LQLEGKDVNTLTREPIRLDKHVHFNSANYDFCVRSGMDAWQDLRRRLMSLDADIFLLVADSGIPPQLIAATESVLASVTRTRKLTVHPGEDSKRLTILDQLADQAITFGVSRKSVVVALGGGVAGNIAGLLAALLFRGIRLVHMPTTLLGMSDSALSLKQAVNSQHGKNHIGTFYAPILVWNQLDFLETLPPDEIRSALCEMIKNVLCIVPERYDEVARWLRPDAGYSPAELADFIGLCLEAKAKVMAHDQFEKGEALILEYGHTVGHAAELLSRGRIRHGFAVGLGMLAAARVSRQLGYMSRSDEAAHLKLLELNGAPTRMISGLTADDILGMCRHDNKRGYVNSRAGQLDLVLLAGLGRPLRQGDSLITQVSEAVVRSGITSLINFEPVLGR